MDADSLLDLAEANNRAMLYKARFDDQTAARIVPALVSLLDVADRALLLRVFRAFVTLCRPSGVAAEKIVPYLQSSDLLVAQTAIWALASVSKETPEPAIDSLIDAANVAQLRRPAIQALLGFGDIAKKAAPVFVKAFGDRSAAMRCLALRALAETKAPQDVVAPVLDKAARDKSKRVIEYAARKFALQS